MAREIDWSTVVMDDLVKWLGGLFGVFVLVQIIKRYMDDDRDSMVSWWIGLAFSAALVFGGEGVLRQLAAIAMVVIRKIAAAIA